MKVTATTITDVLVVEPQVFRDSRGFFFESFNQRDFNAATGTDFSFVQDNHSRSKKNVLRGLHFQVGKPQGRLIRVVRGSVFDVAVDIRPASPTFGKWFGIVLNEHDNRQLWVPPGLAHGFLVLSESADCLYKTTDYYEPELEQCIIWNDPDINIVWPHGDETLLSVKDKLGMRLNKAKLVSEMKLSNAGFSC